MPRIKDSLAMFHGDSIYGCATYPKGGEGKEFDEKDAVGADHCLRCLARRYYCYQRIRMAFYGWEIGWIQPEYKMMR
jgi:hypothetical protein